MGKNQSGAGLEVLMAHLQSVLPVVPSQPVLRRLCEGLQLGGRHQDLCTVVERLLQCRVAVGLTLDGHTHNSSIVHIKPKSTTKIRVGSGAVLFSPSRSPLWQSSSCLWTPAVRRGGTAGWLLW